MPSRPVAEPSSTARFPGTWPRRRREHEPFDRERTEAEHVDEGVAGVALVEGQLATDGRDADRVPVGRDPTDHALEQPALPAVGERAEEQRVHHGERASAHGENVPEDPTDAGGRTLVGLDGRRVVVALDADGDRDAVAGVDDPGILTWAHQHAGPFGRQAAQVHARRFVGTVLAPHHRIQGELERVRLPTEDLDHRRQLVVGEAQCPVQWLGFVPHVAHLDTVGDGLRCSAHRQDADGTHGCQ
jgi:hypothetical protein